MESRSSQLIARRTPLLARFDVCGRGASDVYIDVPNGFPWIGVGRGTCGATPGSTGAAWLIWPGHDFTDGATNCVDGFAGGGSNPTDPVSGLVRVSVVSFIPALVSARQTKS